MGAAFSGNGRVPASKFLQPGLVAEEPMGNSVRYLGGLQPQAHRWSAAGETGWSRRLRVRKK